MTDEEKISQLKNNIRSLQSELSDAKVQLWLQLKSILTPEQRMKLRQMQLGK